MGEKSFLAPGNSEQPESALSSRSSSGQNVAKYYDQLPLEEQGKELENWKMRAKLAYEELFAVIHSSPEAFPNRSALLSALKAVHDFLPPNV